jgi:hypothetical protein
VIGIRFVISPSSSSIILSPFDPGQQTTGNAAFLIGATIKNKMIWLYKSIPIVITNEECSSKFADAAIRKMQVDVYSSQASTVTWRTILPF